MSFSQVKDIEATLSLLHKPVTSQQEYNNVVFAVKRMNVENVAQRAQKSQILIPYIESALDWANEENVEDAIINSELMLMEATLNTKAYSKTVVALENILRFENVLSDQQLVRVINSGLNLYNTLEAYDEAVRIEKLRKKHARLFYGVDKSIDTHAGRLGMVYFRVGNYTKAVENFNRQAYVYRAEKNDLMTSSMFNNVGLSYFKLKNYKKAEEYYDSALVEIRNAIKEQEAIFRPKKYNYYFEKVIEGNIGEIRLEEGNYEEALKYFKEELAAATKDPEIFEARIVCNAYYNIALVYYLKNQPFDATQYITKAMNSLNSFVDTDTKIRVYALQGKLFLLSNEIEKANDAFNISEYTKDSLAAVQLERRNLLALTKFDLDGKEDQLQSSQKEAALSQKLANNQFIALGIAMLSLLFLTFFFVKSQKDKQIIAAQKNTLESSLHEKEILLKEVHHRVKNNLQVITGLLQLQSRKSSSSEMTIAIEDAQRHINSMALVHQMLYQQDDNSLIPMKTYIEKLTNQILYSLSGQHIDTRIAIDNSIELTIHRAIPIGLILSELITNTQKYAFAEKSGEISIGLQPYNDNEYLFLYEDDGKGLPKNYETNLQDTMGFRLIAMLAEEIEGSLSIDGINKMRATIKFTDGRI